MSDIRTLISALFAGPEETLVAISGGAPRTVAGRTLDPRIQFLEYQARQRAPETLTLDGARQAARDLAALCAGDPDPRTGVEDITVPGAEGPLAARAYRPKGQDPAAAPLVWFHQGGGVVGDLDFGHAFCALLAAELRAPVVAVAYRLAPEHPWPAGQNDALAAYRWIAANAMAFGAAKPGAAVGGDSMGGGFAALITQTLRDAGEPQPAAQLLIYPAVSLTAESASMRDFGDAFPLDLRLIAWFLSQYAPPGHSPTDLPEPARAASLAGLAPAFVYTAGFDPICDQGDTYAAALRAAGVATIHRRYDALSHSFTAMIGAVPAAAAAAREIAADLAPALRR